jgi:sulfate adenylyltransferase
VYGTPEAQHPGVAHFLGMGSHFVGGAVKLLHRVPSEFSDQEWTPAETRAWFQKANWKSVVGFQTRNVPHLGHEYLLRLALEQCDGLFIQPIVGQKKTGDFTTASVLTSYRALIKDFLPSHRVLLGVLSTSMRYAGPREAVFHAIIRRNYGCTHFIVGRDHAGVGKYYGKYAAHDLTREFDGRLGIEILRFAGPFHCSRCGGIVTERTCSHETTLPSAVRHISGTDMRNILLRGVRSDLMRPEIIDSVASLPLFINECETT